MSTRPPSSEASPAKKPASDPARPDTASRRDKARKWMWGLLAAFLAVQMYFVRELLAALLLFTIGFATLSGIALGVYGLRKFGLRIWERIRAAGVWTLGKAEELSRKLLRRPRSEPVP